MSDEQLIKESLAAITILQNKIAELEQNIKEPIAVIGMSCRFPGGAESPEEFWSLLQAGFDSSIEVPKDRWDIDQYYDPDPSIPGKIVSRKGSFITSSIADFDADFFGISPREAEYMDPQQRLLLEVTWEALEEARINPQSLLESLTGVFIGISSHDYADLLTQALSPEAISAYFGTGNAASTASGRISYTLGLQGPSLAVDTACSSSLVTIHQACLSLHNGDCQLAIAGGVNVLLSSKISIDFSQAHMLASDGHCKTFDKDADGYVRGEGCGIIILKRLSDALRDNDRILAVIKASAVNQDGTSGGLTVPNGPAQESVIRRALQQAQLQPQDIDYIEAHGTGTALGDPIEFNALAQIFKNRENSLTIGTVKTNIGHLEAAAGIAGVIKTILALQHEQIPKHLHFKEINPSINLSIIPAQIPLQPIEWKKHTRKIRRAGISSFGFSGTNAHVILEEAPEQDITKLRQSLPKTIFNRQRYWAAALDEMMSAAQGIGAYALHWQSVTVPVNENDVTTVIVIGLGMLSKAVCAELSAQNISAKEIILSQQFADNLQLVLSEETQKRIIWCVETRTIVDVSELESYHRLVSECWLALVKNSVANKNQSSPLMGLLHVASDDNPTTGIVEGLRRVTINEMPALGLSAVTVPDINNVTKALRVLLAAEMTGDEFYYDGTQWQALRLGKEDIDNAKELRVNPKGSYLITGGFGAMGQAYVQWLIEHGAKYIILVSRHLPEGEILDKIKHWNENGISVITQAIDISDVLAVESCITTMEHNGYPLKGIIHAAGVLADGIIVNQDWEKFKTVLAGKAWGAWNLHQVTLQHNINLDFFIACSSIAGILGSPGQSNYAAANTFLDGLMRYRQKQGLAGMSIAWGPWANAGMAAELTELQRKRWKRYGIKPLAAEEALTLSSHVSINSAIVSVNWRTWQEPHIPPLLSELVQLPTSKITHYADWSLLWSTRAAKERSAWLLNEVRTLVKNTLGIYDAASTHLADTQGFFEAGMDSLMAVEVTQRVQAHLPQQSIPQTLSLDYPNITALTDYLQSLIEAHPTVMIPQIIYDYSSEPIAIVGMACRFPKAADATIFWNNLLQGVDGITEVPNSRWDNAFYYSPDPDAPGKMITRWGGFIADVDQFDADFFGISPKEAVMLDPQQRLLLETTWHALEKANINPLSLRDSQTGVFIGISGSDYLSLLFKNESDDDIGPYLATGNALSAAAGRLSYTLGLMGPSLAIDTACSSSLVAIHEACEALRHGSCTLALSGGVNLILLPEININLSKAHMLSPEGHCKTFDASADGYVRSDGCGIVVLKRLSDAQRDKDSILALIRGSSVRQDGASGGLTVPNGIAQQGVMRQALAMAHLEPHHITYLEAHGTGTSLGDPIEMRSIQAVYGEREEPLVVGAVKSNIGHTESAAGVASVIKSVLALNKKKIPKNLHFNVLNPKIELTSPIILPTETMTWSTHSNSIRRAAISSFGFTGTIAHMILEEAPAEESIVIPKAVQQQFNNQNHVLIIAAKTENALKQQMESYLVYLKETKEAIYDIAYSSEVTRAHFNKIVVVKGKTIAEWITNLENKNYATESKVGESIYSTEMIPYLKKVTLPLYPFEHQHYWFISTTQEFKGRGFTVDNNRHPFLQHKLAIPHATGWIYESYISEHWPAFISDHLIYGMPVVAGATYLSMLLSWIKESDLGDMAIEDVSFQAALVLETAQQYQVQVVIEPGKDKNEYTFAIYSRNVADNTETWRLHVQGFLRCYTTTFANTSETLKERFLTQAPVYDAARHKEIFDAISITLGPHFQWLEQAWVNEGEVLASFRLPNADEETPAYVIYPGLVDSLFQSALARVADMTDVAVATYIPFSLERMYVAANITMPEWAHIRFQSMNDNKVNSINITLLDKNLNTIGTIKNLISRAATKDQLLQALHKENDVMQWCYVTTWLPYVMSVRLQDLTATNRDVENNTLFATTNISAEKTERHTVESLFVYYDARISLRADIHTSMLAQDLLAFLQTQIATSGNVRRIVIVTEQAYSLEGEEINVDQGALNGLIKTAILEHPELHLCQLDVQVGENIEPLLSLLQQDRNDENILAYRKNAWYVERIEKLIQADKAQQRLRLPAGTYRLEKNASGVLDALHLAEEDIELIPGDDDVVITPQAVGLNFRDVLNAMNLYPGDPGPLGGDCAGIVKAIGKNVHDIVVGDEVLGEALGSLASHALTRRALIVKKPSILSFTEASAIPTVFMTAYYSFITLAKLQAGETVLIHAGAGGVGLAAIQIAQYLKAKIIATAGSDEKRDYLHSIGIEHVFDSRSLSYEADILRVTGGRGVDVVLNSLTGPGFIEASLNCCKENVRFVEISKRDIWSVEQVQTKRPHVMYHIVAMDMLSLNEPEMVQKILQAVMQLFTDKKLFPIPLTLFPLTQAIAAFKFLRQAKQIGKVVVTLPPLAIQFNDQASYLVTGGLGGVGLEVVNYLAEHGAKRIILTARHAPNESVTTHLEKIRAQGVEIIARVCDVSVMKEIKMLIKSVSTKDYPLKGIFHLAGIIEDAPLNKQTKDSFLQVFLPKALGAWNLHEATKVLDIEYFVLFSSMASLNGSPAQSNYATANSFLDALALWRQQKGLNAISINWGPWREVGLAKELVTRQERQGIKPLYTKDALAALTYALKLNLPQLGIMQIDWKKMSGLTLVPSWLETVIGPKISSDFMQRLQATPIEQREDFLKQAIIDEVKTVLGQTQTLDESKGFFDMGMDSLMALELRNRLQTLINRPLSNSLLFDFPNIKNLQEHLVYSILNINKQEIYEKEKKQKNIHKYLNLSEDEIKKIINEDLDNE